MAWETTGFLLGEYDAHDYTTNPVFSVVDGLITVTQRQESGEQQRFLRVVKMRGTEHSRDEHAFVITSHGIEVFAPRVTIHREARADAGEARCRTGIDKLDALLGEGIPRGSSLLITGVAGTGKSIMLLEFVYRGALAGEKGILFSFEETSERLLATARQLGWDFDRQIERGMIELVFIPQPEIVVEGHLLMMAERVAAMGARRVAIDSVSVFLHKITDPQAAREKIFQLASVVQNNGAVGFFATDIPYGSSRISRFGVEETVVDGVLLLTATEELFQRQRYVEIYKLRNTAHLEGRHSMQISRGGHPRLPPLHGGHRRERAAARLAGLRAAALGHHGARCAPRRRPAPAERDAPRRQPRHRQEHLRRAIPRRGRLARRAGPCVHTGGEPRAAPRHRRRALATAPQVGRQGHDRDRFPPARARPGDAVLEHHGSHILRLRARRVFVDGATQMTREALHPDEVRGILHDLIRRFKSLDVTSVLAAESASLHFGDHVTEHGLSPVADNLLMLRYVEGADHGFSPALRVVKTRGSAHDHGAFAFDIGKGGARAGERLGGRATASAPRGRIRKKKKG